MSIAFTPYTYPEGYPESWKRSEETQREDHKRHVEHTTKGCYYLIVNATRYKQYRISVDSGCGVGNPADLDTEALEEMVPGITFFYDKGNNTYTFNWPITFMYDTMSTLPVTESPDTVADITFKPYTYPEGMPEAYKISEETQQENHTKDVIDTTSAIYNRVVNATKNKLFRISVDSGCDVGNPADLDTEVLKELIPGIRFFYDKGNNTYTLNWPITFLA
jgi:hypothetical protein